MSTTNLIKAVQQNKSYLVSTLLESGIHINVNEVDDNNLNALYYAIKNDSSYIASQLLDHGIDPDLQDRNGCTALHIAVKKSSSYLVGILLEARADVNVVDNLGNTALHYAVEKNSNYIACQLLDNKSDIHCKNNNELSPLDLAIKKENVYILSQMKEANGSRTMKSTFTSRKKANTHITIFTPFNSLLKAFLSLVEKFNNYFFHSKLKSQPNLTSSPDFTISNINLKELKEIVSLHYNFANKEIDKLFSEQGSAVLKKLGEVLNLLKSNEFLIDDGIREKILFLKNNFSNIIQVTKNTSDFFEQVGTNENSLQELKSLYEKHNLFLTELHSQLIETINLSLSKNLKIENKIIENRLSDKKLTIKK